MCFGGDAITVIIPAADRTQLEPCLKHATAAAVHARSRQHAVSILVVDYDGAEPSDWVDDSFPEVSCWSSRSPKPCERAVNAATQWALSHLVSSAILLLEAPTLIPPELVTDLHRTVHCDTRLGIIRLRDDDGEDPGNAAVPERGVLPLAMRTRQPGAAELLREDPAAAVLLRGDMVQAVGGLDPAHATGLAVADLVRRAHLDGWTTAWHTAPGMSADHTPSEPGPAWQRLRDELDLIASDPALTWGTAVLLVRAWLGHYDQETRRLDAACAIAALVPRLPRLVHRRRQHRALAIATELHRGLLAPPVGWNPPRPWAIGWERRT